MTAASDVLATYHSPRRVFRRKLESTGDASSFMHLTVACLLLFVGQLPGLLRASSETPLEAPLEALAAGRFLGTMIVAPLALNLVAAVAAQILKTVGWNVTWRQSRVVLFWSLLAVSPWALPLGLAGTLSSAALGHQIVTIAVFLLFLLLWMYGLAQAVRQPSNQQTSIGID
ncbi:MAG: hypothetical protein OXB95_13405 [Rhodobacteraceae bacterium]|nr:hypothetical protein [Paracoccaceae bacterium]